MRGRTALVSRTTSCPSIEADPLVGSRTVDSTLTRVVFPAPFGPRSPWTSPSLMSIDTLSSATTSGLLSLLL